MNIYVGNLSYKAEEQELTELFGAYGEVGTVKILQDRMTGKPRGFGFVEMPNDKEANEAISQLNETEFLGRKLLVNEAREKKPRTDSYDRR